MNNYTNIDNIKRKRGIDDFTSVSNEQFENIQVLAGKGKIIKEEMQLFPRSQLSVGNAYLSIIPKLYLILDKAYDI